MYWEILGAILSAYLIRWLIVAAVQTYYHKIREISDKVIAAAVIILGIIVNILITIFR